MATASDRGSGGAGIAIVDSAGSVGSAGNVGSAGPGECAGSVLGRFDQSFKIARMMKLTPRVKVEGLAFQADGRLLLVADADDPTIASPLFALDDLGDMASAD